VARRIVTHREQVAALAAMYPHRFASVHEPHPDLALLAGLSGCVHTTGGRRLLLPRVAALSLEEQEARLADPTGWERHVAFDPWRHAVEGARGYARLNSLADPHATSYADIRQTPERVRTVGRYYDQLPEWDDRAVPHFEAMARDVDRQFDFAVNQMGVRPEWVDYDPYADVHELLDDLNANRRLRVLGTDVTGGHPYFDDETNNRFRFVHDLFGHAATGRSFDRHGEHASFLAHSRMFSPQALPALATETLGQNSSLILNGAFAPQKVALLKPSMYRIGHRTAVADDDLVPDDRPWLKVDWRTADDYGAFQSSSRPPMSSDLPHPLKAKLSPQSRKRAEASEDPINDPYGILNGTGITFEDLVRNHMDHILNATPEQQFAGRVWYSAARDFAKELSDKTWGDLPRAVAVMSALSPVKAWDDNVEQAAHFLTHYDGTDPNFGFPKAPSKQIQQAIDIYHAPSGTDFAEMMIGNKTRAFYNNILDGTRLREPREGFDDDEGYYEIPINPYTGEPDWRLIPDQDVTVDTHHVRMSGTPHGVDLKSLKYQTPKYFDAKVKINGENFQPAYDLHARAAAEATRRINLMREDPLQFLIPKQAQAIAWTKFKQDLLDYGNSRPQPETGQMPRDFPGFDDPEKLQAWMEKNPLSADSPYPPIPQYQRERSPDWIVDPRRPELRLRETPSWLRRISSTTMSWMDYLQSWIAKNFPHRAPKAKEARVRKTAYSRDWEEEYLIQYLRDNDAIPGWSFTESDAWSWLKQVPDSVLEEWREDPELALENWQDFMDDHHGYTPPEGEWYGSDEEGELGLDTPLFDAASRPETPSGKPYYAPNDWNPKAPSKARPKTEADPEAYDPEDILPGMPTEELSVPLYRGTFIDLVHPAAKEIRQRIFGDALEDMAEGMVEKFRKRPPEPWGYEEQLYEALELEDAHRPLPGMGRRDLKPHSDEIEYDLPVSDPELGPLILDYLDAYRRQTPAKAHETSRGMGRHWSTSPSRAQDFSEVEIKHPRFLPVLLEAEWGGRGEDPLRSNTGGNYADEREITMVPGAPMRITDVSIRPYGNDDWSSVWQRGKTDKRLASTRRTATTPLADREELWDYIFSHMVENELGASDPWSDPDVQAWKEQIPDAVLEEWYANPDAAVENYEDFEYFPDEWVPPRPGHSPSDPAGRPGKSMMFKEQQRPYVESQGRYYYSPNDWNPRAQDISRPSIITSPEPIDPDDMLEGMPIAMSPAALYRGTVIDLLHPGAEELRKRLYGDALEDGGDQHHKDLLGDVAMTEYGDAFRGAVSEAVAQEVLPGMTRSELNPAHRNIPSVHDFDPEDPYYAEAFGNPRVDDPEIGKLILDYLDNHRGQIPLAPHETSRGVGRHWSIDPYVAHSFAVPTHKHPRFLPVRMQADWGGRGEDPLRSNTGGQYDREYEVTMVPGAPMRITDVAIKPYGSEKWSPVWQRGHGDERLASRRRRGAFLSGEALDQHIARLARDLEQNAHLNTSLVYTGPDGTYTPERAALHDEILDEIWERRGKHVPRDRRALILGGLPGSGKSTLLRKLQHIPGLGSPDDFLRIDPDEIKEALIDRGMVPQIEGYTPMELAPLFHQESSHLARRLAQRAMRHGTNIIFDGTLRNPNHLPSRIQELRDAGYEAPYGIFLDIPVERSLASARNRYVDQLERHARGENPYGGRLVPPEFIANSVSPDPQYHSVNRLNFEQGKGAFANAWTYGMDESYRPFLIDGPYDLLDPSQHPAYLPQTGAPGLR